MPKNPISRALPGSTVHRATSDDQEPRFHGRQKPAWGVLDDAWLKATTQNVVVMPSIITETFVEKRRNGTLLQVTIFADDDDEADYTQVGAELWVENRTDPSIARHDLHTLSQLQAIAGRQFASVSELSIGLPGLTFLGTYTYTPGRPFLNGKPSTVLDRLVMASPDPRGARTHVNSGRASDVTGGGYDDDYAF